MRNEHIEKLRGEQTATIFAAIAALNQPAPKGAPPLLSDDRRFDASMMLRGLSALIESRDDLVLHLENAAKAAR